MMIDEQTKITIRIPVRTKKYLKLASVNNDVSFNSFVARILQSAAAEYVNAWAQNRPEK